MTSHHEREWWLECRWLPQHRHTVAAVQSLLSQAQQSLGPQWMTTEHVVAVLDAADPETVVRNWLAGRGTGACHRCGGRFTPNSPAQKFCEDCRPGAYRKAEREKKRRQRNSGSRCPEIGTRNPLIDAAFHERRVAVQGGRPDPGFNFGTSASQRVLLTGGADRA